MKNALSVDLEYWYSNDFLLKYLPEGDLQPQVVEATDGVLKVLDKHDVTATFFVLGSVAERYPELVKKIYESGHEIGSHAYSHTNLHRLSREQFEEELRRSTHAIKSIVHEQPLGFRAPSFSIDQSTSWALALLEKHGYQYDSSIFPARTMLYGVPRAPLKPYRPDRNDIARHDPEGKIIEFPMTVMKSIVNIPVAGGFYLRALPQWFLNYAFRQVNKDRPAIIYFHPWETYKGTPRLNVPPHVRFEAYHGINTSMAKIENLLSKYSFGSIREVLHL